MKAIFEQIFSKFGNKVEKKHDAEFQEKLYLSNLERAYLVGVMAVVAYFFLGIASFFWQSEDGSNKKVITEVVNSLEDAEILDTFQASEALETLIAQENKKDATDRIINLISFLATAVVCIGLIPTFFVNSSRLRAGSLSSIYRNRKLLFFITLALLSAAMLPIAITALRNQGSIVAFATFIIIVNLGFKLPQRINLVVNIFSMILVAIGILYVNNWHWQGLFPNILECLALAITVFIIASYQFQTEILQFNYEKVLQQQNKLTKSQVEAEFSKKIAEIEMTALRAQMNPHFLFNVLNSIKLYMIQNDARTASKYLTKFARLIRLILNNSKSAMIKLSEELTALKLYIEMENFRFNDKFDYEIRVDETIDVDEIDIPPMILQPYVENAIWHGLMHKEDDRGLLKLSIKRNRNDGGLNFVIEDNGIGREKASQIKPRNANKHKSVGMQITKDRIAIANKLFNTNASVEIVDLMNKAKATGTKVVVHLPTTSTLPKPVQEL
ncbi:MAG: histidine kinase [Bacteroidota bacterium]